jgi:cytochrome b561
MNSSSSAMVAVSGNALAGFRPAVSTQAAPAAKYSTTARLLHWLSALVVLWAMISGLAAGILPLDYSSKAALINLNVSLTTLFIPVFLYRMAYAAFSTKPRQLEGSSVVKKAAKVAHSLLYLLTLVVLLSGVLMMTRDISLFGLISLPNPLDHAYLNSKFALVHAYSCRLLGVLVLLHVVAVIRHQRAGRNALARMT